MNITCPHCNFSRKTDPERVPEGPVRITCPSCGARFQFTRARAERAEDTPSRPDEEKETSDAAAPLPSPEPSFAPPPEEGDRHGAPERVTPTLHCSGCGLEQPVGERCRGCGAVFVTTEAPGPEYAGFWIRVVAAIVDSALVTALQVVLGFALGLTAGALGGLGGNDAAMAFTTWLFGMVLAVAYYVFFTGYCGQTPGKMAVRVKVVRTDGSEIGYWRAGLREVPGKFLSGVLFGIGYLMVAFDSRKQGLHDKIADTYVIKL